MPITHEGATYYSQAELDEQLTPLRTEAEQARGSLTRYQAAAAAGITDGDTIWALEQAHQRQMASVQDQAARVDFPTWLGQVKATPDLAPAYLRNVLAPPAQAAQPATAPKADETVTGPGPAGSGGGVSGGATAAAPGVAQGASGAQGTGPGAASAGERPAWAPAVAGQRQVVPGGKPDFAARVQAAANLQELAAIAAERRQRR